VSHLKIWKGKHTAYVKFVADRLCSVNETSQYHVTNHSVFCLSFPKDMLISETVSIHVTAFKFHKVYGLEITLPLKSTII